MWLPVFSKNGKGGYDIKDNSTGKFIILNDVYDVAEYWAYSRNIEDGYINSTNIQEESTNVNY